MSLVARCPDVACASAVTNSAACSSGLKFLVPVQCETPAFRGLLVPAVQVVLRPLAPCHCLGAHAASLNKLMAERGDLDLTGAKQNTGVWLVKVRREPRGALPKVLGPSFPGHCC